MDRALTLKVNLPGGQDRLRQLILYVCQRNHNAPRFGRIKLNKILWKSDFGSYAARGRPVTGRTYQRLPQGPAPKEMLPVYREMIHQQVLTEEWTDFGSGMVEMRPVARQEPNLSMFDSDDMEFVHRAIDHYWFMSGTETSDNSHGAAWSTRNDGDPMPYESALLSDRKLGRAQMERLRQMALARGLATQ